jgi:hypothetical protein
VNEEPVFQEAYLPDGKELQMVTAMTMTVMTMMMMMMWVFALYVFVGINQHFGETSVFIFSSEDGKSMFL